MSTYNENEMTLADLMADPAYQDRNNDITTEDFRALLAEEIMPIDIIRRRARIAREAEMARREARRKEAVKKRMAEYQQMPTRSLLYRFRKQRTFGYRNPEYYYDDDRYGYDINTDWRIHIDAMREVLNTREHVEASQQGAKAMRRAAAMKYRGQGKSKNRGGGK